MVSKGKNISVVYLAILAVNLRGVCGQYNVLGLHPSEKTTVWCFQCTSLLDKDCAYVQPNETSSYHYKPCLDSEKYNGTTPFCRKIVQKIIVRNNMEIVIRKCGWVRHPRLDCYTMKNEDHEETICQCFTTGCNGASSLQQLKPLTLALTGLLLYYRLGGL